MPHGFSQCLDGLGERSYGQYCAQVISDRLEQVGEHSFGRGPGVPADFGVLVGVADPHRSTVDWISSDVDHVPPGFGVSSFSDLIAGDNSEAGLFEGFSHGGVGVDLAHLLSAAGKGPLRLAVMTSR